MASPFPSVVPDAFQTDVPLDPEKINPFDSPV